MGGNKEKVKRQVKVIRAFLDVMAFTVVLFDFHLMLNG